MESADEIFAVRGIYLRLAADRRIDLRQERRRRLNIPHAALDAGRRKARKIADHPAPNRDHRMVALDPEIEKRVAYAFKLGEALGGLARGHVDWGAKKQALCGKSASQFLGIGSHRLVGHDGEARVRQKLLKMIGSGGDKAAPNKNGVAPVSEFEIHAQPHSPS